MIKETPLTIAEQNEFHLNRLGYYCKVRESWEWNNTLKKSIRKGFLFDIVQYDNDQEVVIQKGTKLFSCGEVEAIKKRNDVIEYYLKKVEK